MFDFYDEWIIPKSVGPPLISNEQLKSLGVLEPICQDFECGLTGKFVPEGIGWKWKILV